jgi:transposase-like protein
MKRERRKFTNAFKTEVVLEALKEKRTIAELAEHYKLYPTQIAIWKAEFLSKSANVFGLDQSESADEKQKKQKLEEDLYALIGRLKMENEWLKKKLQ